MGLPKFPPQNLEQGWNTNFIFISHISTIDFSAQTASDLIESLLINENKQPPCVRNVSSVCNPER